MDSYDDKPDRRYRTEYDYLRTEPDRRYTTEYDTLRLEPDRRYWTEYDHFKIEQEAREMRRAQIYGMITRLWKLVRSAFMDVGAHVPQAGRGW
jgi:hypothetical protein